MTRTSGKAPGILPLLWSFAFLSYLLRTNISVAQQYMAREMHWTDQQVGWIFTSFLIGYTLFQVPAGMLGDRFGARLVLTVSGLLWGLTTGLTGLVPGTVFAGTVGALWALFVVRFILGVGQASTYPVIMIAVRDYFDVSRHAFVNSIIFTGSTLGAALAPPIVAYIMVRLGWRATFYATAVLPIIVATLWWSYSRSGPRVGSGISSLRSWWPLLRNADVVLLCVSYLMYCYTISIFVYWLFKYLVDVRHLSILNSSWANSAPWIAASATVPVVGWISGRLSERRGSTLYGRRLTAVVCLFIAACLVFVVADSNTIGIALGAITLSVALLFSTESAYWSMAIELAPAEAGAVSGLMNLMGNAGGMLATSLVPVIVHLLGWFAALVSGSLLAVLAAVFWLFIDGNNSTFQEQRTNRCMS